MLHGSYSIILQNSILKLGFHNIAGQYNKVSTYGVRLVFYNIAGRYTKVP